MTPKTLAKLRNLLPPLTPAELENLEAGCLEDPKHTAMPPVLIWNRGPDECIIIDGHNQYAIRHKHKLNIRYVYRTYQSIETAVAAARRIQSGRRNTTELPPVEPLAVPPPRAPATSKELRPWIVWDAAYGKLVRLTHALNDKYHNPHHARLANDALIDMFAIKEHWKEEVHGTP